MLRTALVTLLCVLCSCQLASPPEGSGVEQVQGVPEHNAHPAGESPAPRVLPEGSSSEADIRAALTGGVPGGR